MNSRPRAAEAFDIDFGGGTKKPPMYVHDRCFINDPLFPVG